MRRRPKSIMDRRRNYFGRVVVVGLVFAQMAEFASAQNCLLAANGGATPFTAVMSNSELPSGTQAIITSYKFGCCGNITAWQTYVQPGGRRHKMGAYDITFQVWRPSPTVQDGCYILVGENKFLNIILGDKGLVSETPEPSNILTVQLEDVVGYFTFSREDPTNSGIQLDTSRNDEVWYNTGESLINVELVCTLATSGRNLMSFINAAPLLSVSVSTFPCSSTPIIPPSSSSSLPPSSSSSLPPPSSSSLPPSSSSRLLPSNPPTTTTSVPSNKPTAQTTIILAVVLVVLVVSVLAVLTVVLLLLWKRKRLQGKMKLEVASGNSVDLSNPSYDSAGFQLKQGNEAKKQQGPYVPPYQPSATYETIDTGDPLPYPNLMPAPVNHTSSSINTYAYISDLPRRDEVGKTEEKTLSLGKEAVYTAVLPKNKRRAGDSTSNGSTPAPSLPPPFVDKDGTERDGLYHVLAEATEDASLQCKDLLYGNEQDSVKQKVMFESTGYYVPTEEERKTFGPNHVQQYESMSEMYSRLNFFVEDPIYWTPAATTSGIYAQLASKKYREIQRDQMRVLEKLGSGQFGEVCKALWTVDGHTLELAVKTLKHGASEEDKVKFLQEAAIMGQFSHSNIIKMYGVVTLGEPVLICLEILANGDLRRYLQTLKLRGSKFIDFIETQTMFLKFAKGIAAGMEYLSKKSFVHRDLAARNILLDKSLTCKIGDFGMARNLMDETYYQSSGGQVPVKWTAPEALLYKKYSADSDVWSYGMVLFEIWSVAKKPFSTASNNQVLRLIEKGFCQAPPPGCPRAIYELMVECWNPDHTCRPSFSKICSRHLHQSSAKILYWDPENENLSPNVGVCGAPLEESHKLHLDLQDKYKDYDDII